MNGVTDCEDWFLWPAVWMTGCAGAVARNPTLREDIYSFGDEMCEQVDLLSVYLLVLVSLRLIMVRVVVRRGRPVSGLEPCLQGYQFQGVQLLGFGRAGSRDRIYVVPLLLRRGMRPGRVRTSFVRRAVVWVTAGS